MTYFTEEQLTVPTSLEVQTLSPTILRDSSQRPTSALLANRSTDANNVVIYRFGNAPSSTLGFRLAQNEQVEVKGLDNLLNLQFSLLTAVDGDGELYVAYAR